MKIGKLPNSDSYDFTKMNDQDYYAFRYAFVEEKLFYQHYNKNENQRVMEAILGVLCMVICGRVPKGIVPYKCEQLINRIRLTSIPKGVEVERRIVIEKEPPSEGFPDGREIETVIEPNTNEKAVVRILVPTKKVPISQVQDEASPRGGSSLEKTGEKPKDEGEAEDKKENELKPPEEKKEEEMVEIEEDQNEMGLAIANRVSLPPPYSVYVINQYAQRVHR